MNGDAYFDRMEMIDNMQEALNRGYAKGYADAKAKFERPHGKWIDVNGDGSIMKCSKCGDEVCCKNNNFCPNCGASMRKEGDGNE